MVQGGQLTQEHPDQAEAAAKACAGGWEAQLSVSPQSEAGWRAGVGGKEYMAFNQRAEG